MKLPNFVPTPPEMGREIIIVLVGVLGAAFILSRFPKLQAFVSANSVTVKDGGGQTIW